jgi:hypothetical protein
VHVPRPVLGDSRCRDCDVTPSHSASKAMKTPNESLQILHPFTCLTLVLRARVASLHLPSPYLQWAMHAGLSRPRLTQASASICTIGRSPVVVGSASTTMNVNHSLLCYSQVSPSLRFPILRLPASARRPRRRFPRRVLLQAAEPKLPGVY